MTPTTRLQVSFVPHSSHLSESRCAHHDTLYSKFVNPINACLTAGVHGAALRAFVGSHAALHPELGAQPDPGLPVLEAGGHWTAAGQGAADEGRRGGSVAGFMVLQYSPPSSWP